MSNLIIIHGLTETDGDSRLFFVVRTTYQVDKCIKIIRKKLRKCGWHEYCSDAGMRAAVNAFDFDDPNIELVSDFQNFHLEEVLGHELLSNL